MPFRLPKRVHSRNPSGLSVAELAANSSDSYVSPAIALVTVLSANPLTASACIIDEPLLIVIDNTRRRMIQNLQPCDVDLPEPNTLVSLL